MPITIDDIRKAADEMQGHIKRTPTISTPLLSQKTGVDLYLKLENLQVTGSFKSRGSYTRLAALTAEERNRGVIAVSAGNHAQGVAFHAQQMGVPAIIYMPKATPFTKVGRTEELGASVVLIGENLIETRLAALKRAEADQLTFIHPYDDELVITGQGSVALEMLEDQPDLEVLIVPVGGGGLISGVAIAAKAINPDIEIIGAEALMFPSMKDVLEGREPRGEGQTIAEGIAVREPGEVTRKIIAELVSDIVLVKESSIEQAIQTFVEEQRLVAEGAGAAPLAVVMDDPERFANRKVGLIVSGGNLDSRLLSSILMRGLVRGGRLVSLRIEIADIPGVLSKITGLIGNCGGNIIEVHHQRLFYNVPVKRTDLDVVIETVDAGHVHEILQTLTDAGFKARQLDSSHEGA